MGRPSKYNRRLANKIIDRIAAGEVLVKICEEPGMPTRQTFVNWARNDVDGLFAIYARARDIGIDAMVERVLVESNTTRKGVRATKAGPNGVEIVTIYDAVDRSTLYVNTVKWAASKLASRRWGDRAGADEDTQTSSAGKYKELFNAIMTKPEDEEEDGPAPPTSSGPGSLDGGLIM